VTAHVSSSNRFPHLDKYELLEEIGHGGMATVYRARDLRLEREVAIKLIHKHLRDNPEVRSRFVAEARAVAKLRHAGIVEVFDVSSEQDEERYLVVELIRGPSLRRVLQEHHALPAEIGAAIVLLLCRAVDHAHGQGVIHRDIKPENVLVELPRPSGAPTPSSATSSDTQREAAETRKLSNGGGDAGAPEAGAQAGDEPAAGRSDSGEGDAAPAAPREPGELPKRSSGSPARVSVKLTDFGIAKVLDVQGVTSTGQILGSPAHMAPEQIEGGQIGPHTDVFALGVLFYEAVVGHLPFEGKNPAQVLRRVLDGDYSPADTERAEVGGRWALVLARALDRRVESRLASAAELGALVEEELRELGIGDPRGALAEYFREPSAYRERLSGELVPKLLARGERARRKGLVLEAAADFNRALAFRPDDLGILRRVSSLSARALWKRRMTRVCAIAAGSLALGGLTFLVTRWARPLLASGPEAGGAASVRTASAPAAPPAPPGAESATPAGSGRGGGGALSATAGGPPPSDPSGVGDDIPVRPALVASVAPRPPPSGKRRVRFVVVPNGARMTLDGRAVDWSAVFELAPGAYTIAASMPEGNNCCDPVSSIASVSAPPADDPDKLEEFKLRLPYRPARVVLEGEVPPGGVLTCGAVGLIATKSSPGSAIMTQMELETSCSFSPGSGATSVRLRAGDTRSVRWRD
jgi:serine/threonine-protein kinase